MATFSALDEVAEIEFGMRGEGDLCFGECRLSWAMLEVDVDEVEEEGDTDEILTTCC